MTDTEIKAIKNFIGDKVRFDEFGGGYFLGEGKDGDQMIAEVRGWGAIQNLFKRKDGSVDFKKAEEFQDNLGKWIAEAINNHLKSKPAREEFAEYQVSLGRAHLKIQALQKQIDELRDVLKRCRGIVKLGVGKLPLMELERLAAKSTLRKIDELLNQET